jgi:hypothetical protein
VRSSDRLSRELLADHVSGLIETEMAPLLFESHVLAAPPGPHCGVSDGSLTNMLPLASAGIAVSIPPCALRKSTRMAALRQK